MLQTATSDLVIVGLAAMFTATITAIAGLGGGIVLLTVLLLVVDPLVAIPIHAVIQLVSNSSRAVVLRDQIAWPLVGRFSILLLPAGVVGLAIASAIPATGSCSWA